MIKIWTASDNTCGYTITADNITGPEYAENLIANYSGETGQIFHIWNDENDERNPDIQLYWDWKECKFKYY